MEREREREILNLNFNINKIYLKLYFRTNLKTF
jgi:hypothetical protein